LLTAADWVAEPLAREARAGYRQPDHLPGEYSALCTGPSQAPAVGRNNKTAGRTSIL